MPEGTPLTVAVASSFPRKSNLFLFFAFLEQREVMPMYITWETLFLFCTLIVAIISLVLDILNKKR